MKANFPEDEVLKTALQKISNDKSLTTSFMNTFNDVLAAYFSSCYIFGDYFALVGSNTFIDFLNTKRSKNSASNYFNRIDDAMWSYGILSLSILLGLDSQEKKHRSIKRLAEDLEKLKVQNIPELNITNSEEELIENYRHNRVAHWNYKNNKIQNLKYTLPVEILNKVRNYIVEIYYIVTDGAGFGLPTVRERMHQRARSVASLFGCETISKEMANDVSDIPENKWIIPGGNGAAI